MSNQIKIVYGKTETCPVYQWDYGQVLIFEGFGDLLPSTDFEVHFAAIGDTESEGSIGDASGVDVPDDLLEGNASITAWVYLHTGEEDGETEYRFTIPLIQRAQPPATVVPPEQASIITQAIAALQSGVRRAEAAADLAEDKAVLSESWAVGGTGTRPGEDTDNAKYYAERAAGSESAASGYAERAESAEDAAQGHAEDAQEAEGAAQGYASAAADSASAADASADRAEQAATTAGYLDVEIDQYGRLIYIRTDAVDIDFDLDQYGHLIMEAIA